MSISLLGVGQPIKHTQEFKHIQEDNTVSPSSTDILCDGNASVVIQVHDATAITINVYGTTTGVEWDLLSVVSLSGIAHTWTQITDNGLWATGCAGLSRIRLTTVSLTGTANIYVGLSTAAFAWPYCCDSTTYEQPAPGGPQ